MGEDNKKKNISYNLRLTITGEEKFFGPGIAKLLHLIDEYGSIRSAAMAMDMSYSKAWKILRRADKELGYPMLESKNGGDGGGKSSLTPEGRAFLNNYDNMERELAETADKLLKKYF